MEYHLDFDDPVGQLLEQTDRFLSRQKDSLISSFANLLGDVIRPEPSTHRPPPKERQAPPKKPRAEAPKAPPVEKEDPRDVLGFGPDIKLTKALVKERQRALAAIVHPDKNGSTRAMQRINDAAKTLIAGLK